MMSAECFSWFQCRSCMECFSTWESHLYRAFRSVDITTLLLWYWWLLSLPHWVMFIIWHLDFTRKCRDVFQLLWIFSSDYFSSNLLLSV